MSPNDHNSAFRNKQLLSLLIPAGIAVVTWLFLKACLQNQFTNWDDVQYITNNALIKDISFDGLKAIFTTPVLGNYHPLTILSYAIEYSAAGLAPWLYHFDSLTLHIIATLLVYWFVIRLTRSQVASAVTALLFGLHPMHIESIAWISGRKDELSAIFYIGACIAYLYNLQRRALMQSLLVILLFILALLCKPTAVTLPFALLLIDYFQKRKWSWQALLQKLPYFVIALVFGIIAINVQHSFGAITAHTHSYNIIDRLALGSYALCTYLLKAVVPTGLHCFYPYPLMHDGISFVCYGALVVVITATWATWKFTRKNVPLIFGLLFFLSNIMLLLQFIPVGDAIVAERYSYIPYIGLFIVAGWYISSYLQKQPSRGKALLATSFAYILCLGFISNARCAVWYNSITLWTDEIAKEPNAPVAYDNLAVAYFDTWNTSNDRGERRIAADSATYLFKKSIEMQPDSATAYEALAMLSYRKNDLAAALAYFRTSVHLRPSADAYSNFGNFLVIAGQPDSAFAAYNAAIAANPDLFAPYLNRGKILLHRAQFPEAMQDFNTAKSLKPTYAEVYYERSFCDTQMLNKTIALKDVETAISLGYSKVDTTYYNSLKK